MESIIDWDELETDLSEKKNTKKMWISIFSLIAIMAITNLTTTLNFDSSEFTGVFGEGWSWDYNNFFVLMLSITSTSIILGLKIQAGLSKVVAKNKILNKKNQLIKKMNSVIKERDDVINELKRVIDDKCATEYANKQAIDENLT